MLKEYLSFNGWLDREKRKIENLSNESLDLLYRGSQRFTNFIKHTTGWTTAGYSLLFVHGVLTGTTLEEKFVKATVTAIAMAANLKAHGVLAQAKYRLQGLIQNEQTARIQQSGK